MAVLLCSRVKGQFKIAKSRSPFDSPRARSGQALDYAGQNTACFARDDKLKVRIDPLPLPNRRSYCHKK